MLRKHCWTKPLTTLIFLYKYIYTDFKLSCHLEFTTKTKKKQIYLFYLLLVSGQNLVPKPAYEVEEQQGEGAAVPGGDQGTDPAQQRQSTS